MHRVGRNRQVSKTQPEPIEEGLRVLARMIARRYLKNGVASAGQSSSDVKSWSGQVREDQNSEHVGENADFKQQLKEGDGNNDEP